MRIMKDKLKTANNQINVGEKQEKLRFLYKVLKMII